MSLILRPYQQEAASTLWKALSNGNRALCVASTGSGKTEVFIELCKRAVVVKPDAKIMVILNKVNLVSQTALRMSKYLKTGVYCETLRQREKSNVTIASIQSAYNADFGLVNWVIVDEVHRMGYREDSQYQRLIKRLTEMNDRLKVIGFTATPFRSTGLIYGQGQFFHRVDFKITLEELWEQGYLIKPVCKRGEGSFDTSRLAVKMGEFDQAEVTKLTSDEVKARVQINDAMPKLVGRKKVAWACANINHAEIVAKLLPEDCSLVHSSMSRDQQISNRREFEKGSRRHIVFVNILGEGYDFPPIDAIVLLCPTKSPIKYVQTVGRALRLYPDKVDALILDYGEVISNCGPITDPHIPKKGERAGKDTRMKFCPTCLTYVPVAAERCSVCDYIFSMPKRAVPLLSQTSYTGSIIEHPSKLLNIKSVKLCYHNSSNGNDCLRIDYYVDNLLELVVPEYFSWEKEYARLLLSRRLLLFGLIIKDTLRETINQGEVKHVPKQIEVVQKRFPEIKRIIFAA